MDKLLRVADQREVLEISQPMLLAYCGSSQIIATALIYRLMDQAFGELSPRLPPRRDRMAFLTAFPGRGVLECVEMVMRLPSLAPERLVLDLEAGPPEAPSAFKGRFYFEIQVEDRRRGYWPVPGYLDDEFRHQVATWQGKSMDDAQYRAYLDYKEAKARTLLEHQGPLFVSLPLEAGNLAAPRESWFGHGAYRDLYDL